MTDDLHIPGYALPRVMLRIVGIACIALGGLALLYCTTMIVSVSTNRVRHAGAPYTFHFFALFTSIVLILQVLLLFCGYQLVRYRTNVRHLLLGCSVAIVLVMIGGGFLWTVPDRRIAMSAGAATGIGLGGLSLYWLTLFPIWAPAITYWAHKRLYHIRNQRINAGCCAHCGYDRRGSTGACPECGLVD